MKYIPGSAKIEYSAINSPKHQNTFVVYTQCDSNDGDYVEEEFEIEELTELDILMIPYLQMSSYSCDDKWAKENEVGKSFGGEHIYTNNRFNPDGWKGYENWLESYASGKGFLIYCGNVQENCHSINNLFVSWFDEKGKEYSCDFPNIMELFDSEKEFIEYIKQLRKEMD